MALHDGPRISSREGGGGGGGGLRALHQVCGLRCSRRCAAHTFPDHGLSQFHPRIEQLLRLLRYLDDRARCERAREKATVARAKGCAPMRSRMRRQTVVWEVADPPGA